MIRSAVVGALVFWFALCGVAIDSELAVDTLAGTKAAGNVHVLEATSLLERLTPVPAHASLLGGYI